MTGAAGIATPGDGAPLNGAESRSRRRRTRCTDLRARHVLLAAHQDAAACLTLRQKGARRRAPPTSQERHPWNAVLSTPCLAWRTRCRPRYLTMRPDASTRPRTSHWAACKCEACSGRSAAITLCATTLSSATT
eukprot:scaffold110546_cov58-Phaeocystis_antarctica.AAC.2